MGDWSDCEAMKFPNTFDEFVDSYGFIDTEEIYTNGSQLIPVFRVKQWLEHVSALSENKCFDGMTNGEVMMTLFPNENKEQLIWFHGEEWWNTPYQKGGE